MKTIMLLIILKIGMLTGAQIENAYLKITVDQHTEINYPANSSFELVDKNGYTLITSDMMTSEYKVSEKATLKLKTDWKPEPEIIELQKGSVIKYVSKNQQERNLSLNRMEIAQNAVRNQSNGVTINKKTFTEDDSGYYSNAIIEFSNGVVFKFTDNKVSFTQNGKELEFKNRYVVTTQDGILKLSYDPYTTETWFVFEPEQD